jgi:hypothetical protein
MSLLTSLIQHLGVSQRPYQKVSIKPSQPPERETNTLANLAEISRQGLVPLEILKLYHLEALTGTSQQSLTESLLDINSSSLDNSPLIWVRQSQINLLIWSGNQIKLFPANQPVQIDHPTLMLYLNKYGQYFPIVGCKSENKFFRPGTENPGQKTSYLLLKLLGSPDLMIVD